MTEKTIRKHLQSLGYIVRKLDRYNIGVREYAIIDIYTSLIVKWCCSWDEVEETLSSLEA